jgi:hydrogenase maturation protein HypF
MQAPALRQARRFRIEGVVQGVGFRPFVYRLASELQLDGWVLNAGQGVEIHAEGSSEMLDRFTAELQRRAPPAARVAALHSQTAANEGFTTFEIRTSERGSAPTVRISPDLPVCEECLREMFDSANRRHLYPYINCTQCGPRYSIVTALPYDRPNTTMRDWEMCSLCQGEYDDPHDRRFHAQPTACPVCGPVYVLLSHGVELARGTDAIVQAERMLGAGNILALKGIGGYHLACDARDAAAVQTLRERKFRKERPFAVMVRDVHAAEAIVELAPAAAGLLQSQARPIVLAPARVTFEGVAPENHDLGVMLAYTPLHHLLFEAGAPPVLVMTSANRSSEPIAYSDEDARARLGGIADALLIGEREIARRVDDSVARVTLDVPAVLRHSRGYAPRAVASLPGSRPILATGADLKNAIAIVVRGQAFVSQHIGDLEHYEALLAFKETIRDLAALYEVPPEDLCVAYDAHPEYASSTFARELPGEKLSVQHHRAHVASVLAERGALEADVLGFAFDGTGYGEDATIWGGEVFSGSVARGFDRVAHLRPAKLPGGDAAARFPVQAAAGFLYGLDVPDLHAAPFGFPARYDAACELLRTDTRVFATTSMGRLFDTAAALLGFTRAITYEAQAAMWLETLARSSAPAAAYPFPFEDAQLDYRPLLSAVVADRVAGRHVHEIARAFHEAIVQGVLSVCADRGTERIVVSGGVFQNALLLERLMQELGERLWSNRETPCNDGGICLGQAAIAASAYSAR